VAERTFGVRGIVEGFYGPPWSHDARLELLEFIGARGMNAYAYAPKDDAKHREGWREPYDAEEMRRFAELTECACEHGVRFGFALSPGLDIDYESADDRAVLVDKMLGLVDAGVSWFLLLLDDIPMQPGLAPRQGALATALLDTLRATVQGVTLTVCPTEYVGVHSSPYLDALGRGLPPDVAVMWTGPTVCSPTISAAQARARAASVGGRPPLLWDNYPVNDATMTASLHLGAYTGRDAKLAGVLSGVLCNPMIQPRASKVALGTAAAFLTRPDTYEPALAWEHAIADAGGDHAEQLRVLAHACADSPLHAPEQSKLMQLVGELRGAIDGPEWMAPVAALATWLRAARALPDAFGDSPLATEVAPWVEAARVEAEAGLAALRLLQQIRPVVSIDGDGGRAAAPDAERAMEHAFVMLFCWKAARGNQYVVFGPRFAIYTPVVQLAGGQRGMDVSLALREDQNAIDRLCRLALRAYGDWTSDASASLQVFVDGDGDERPCVTDAGGHFDARGGTALVRTGRYATRAGAALPFRDRRLE
jgi:hyaluronoglucosaminidase